MTEEGAIIGTAQYLSPEQARGAPVDQTSDLYSTGIVLFELLTGEVPFTGDSPVEIAMKHLGEMPPLPSDLRPDVPDDLDLVVVRALAKEPADRYQSAAAMDADLETVARGGRIAAETAEAATMVLAGEHAGDATARDADRTASTAPAVRAAEARPIALAVAGRARGRARGCSSAAGSSTGRSRISSKGPIPSPSRTSSGSRARSQPHGSRTRGSSRRSGACRTRTSRRESSSRRTRPRARASTRESSSASTSRPESRRSRFPSVVGQSVEDAVAELTRAGLNAQVVEVNSDRDEGTVTGQSPGAGLVVVEGTQVRINVSKGPRPVTVPSVVGLPYDQAAAELQQAGFGVLADRRRLRPGGRRSSPIRSRTAGPRARRARP